MSLDDELKKAKADLESRPPLFRDDYTAGLAWLKERWGGDFDRFFRETSGETLLNQPLGSDSQCLSIAALELSLKGDPNSHLATCKFCTANLKLLQELQSQAVTRAPALFGASSR